MDGLLIPYACAARTDADAPCRQKPVLLITSNIHQSAACAEHLSEVLNSNIDAVLRSKNGELEYGFLHQATATKQRPHRSTELATDEIVWQARLDDRYDAVVLRTKQPYLGVLVLRDGATELLRSDVGLSYNAMLGPDAADVLEWMDIASSTIDAGKPQSQLINEAIERVDRMRAARIERLRSSSKATDAYQLAIGVFRHAESAVEWLISGDGAANAKVPADLLDEPSGLERIGKLLNEIVKTIYPLS